MRNALVSRKRRLLFALAALAAAAVAIAIPVYLTVPRSNGAGERVDVLLVLGSPTWIDGTLTANQRWRVDEAVREFRAGRAPRILFAGGRTTLQYVEADTMARYALRQGIPESAVLEERGSRTTLENIEDSQEILDANGWRSVEVISSPEHLPRTALLLRSTHLLWRVHPAPTPGRSHLQQVAAYIDEALGTTAFRLFGTGAEPVLHALATVQHRTAFGVRWVYYKLRGEPLRV
jgi:uncharacterized SAM-binding protein YcdF (DUF218 family)